MNVAKPRKDAGDVTGTTWRARKAVDSLVLGTSKVLPIVRGHEQGSQSYLMGGKGRSLPGDDRLGAVRAGCASLRSRVMSAYRRGSPWPNLSQSPCPTGKQKSSTWTTSSK